MKRSNPAWRVGSLRLRVPHMSQADARWIAREVTRSLAATRAPAVRRDNLTIRIPSAGSRERIAEQVVSAIVKGSR